MSVDSTFLPVAFLRLTWPAITSVASDVGSASP